MEVRNIRLADVIRKTGLSKSEIYRRITEKRFPAQKRISHRVSVWKEADVDAWVAAN